MDSKEKAYKRDNIALKQILEEEKEEEDIPNSFPRPSRDHKSKEKLLKNVWRFEHEEGKAMTTRAIELANKMWGVGTKILKELILVTLDVSSSSTSTIPILHEINKFEDTIVHITEEIKMVDEDSIEKY